MDPVQILSDIEQEIADSTPAFMHNGCLCIVPDEAISREILQNVIEYLEDPSWYEHEYKLGKREATVVVLMNLYPAEGR